MILPILICFAALWVLLALLRADRLSLGLPFAYLASLLLIHVPGAYAHLVSGQSLAGDKEASIGIGYTAVGAVFFVGGVWLARVKTPAAVVLAGRGGGDPRRRASFSLFCLLGGWLFVYGLAMFRSVPSIGAVIDRGAAVWLLGVMLGLRGALQARNLRAALPWGAALVIYSALSLILGGFLGYGSTAAIIATAVLAVEARSHWRTMAGVVVAIILGISLFTSYFEQRTAIRAAVWGGASMEQRLRPIEGVFTNLHLFDPNRSDDISALDLRLNQNYFVGLSAERIQSGESRFLNGRSIWEGFLSLVPRILWPEKPVFGGSPKIVAEMTGLHLSTTTSFGVGNVMEFYINFGLSGVAAGFVLLGWLLGRLDLEAAAAERAGDFGSAIVFFLPAAALIQPNGSIVEMTGGGAAALLAAFAWSFLWRMWSTRRAAAGSACTARPHLVTGP